MNMTDPRSLSNWVETFKLVCAPKSEFGYFGSTFFIGLVIGSLTLPRLSDKYGRKKLAALGGLLHVFAGMNVLFTQNLNWALTCCWMMGFGTAGRMFVMYVWLVENMRSQDAGKVTSFMFFIDSLGIFHASIYFKYISDDWRFIYGLPIFALTFVVAFFIMQNESPKFFYGIG
jgi:MFS family permease